MVEARSPPCGSGDPRWALHGQPAMRAASSARRNPRSVPRLALHGQPAPRAASRARRNPRSVPRLALHGQPAPRAASRARRNPRSALAAMRTLQCDGHRTDRDGAVAPTVPALEASPWSLEGRRPCGSSHSAAIHALHRDGHSTIAVPVGAAASPRYARCTVMVMALVATGTSLPQSLRLKPRRERKKRKAEPSFCLLQLPGNQPALR